MTYPSVSQSDMAKSDVNYLPCTPIENLLKFEDVSDFLPVAHTMVFFLALSLSRDQGSMIKKPCPPHHAPVLIEAFWAMFSVVESLILLPICF